MSSIKSSVGQGGANLPADVKVVQELLNKAFAKSPGVVKLKEDGSCGPKTIARIKEFQTAIMKMAAPDGRVDPGGKTFTSMGGTAASKRPAHVESFIQKVLPAAKKVKKDSGVPVAVCIAQAALETGWGSAVKDNAYFGIKGKSASGSTTFTTTEFVNGQKLTMKDTFRAYTSLDEAADDYGQMLKNNLRYAAAFKFPNDPARFAEELQKAGYATDPNYAQKLKSIMNTYGLVQYDQ